MRSEIRNACAAAVEQLEPRRLLSAVFRLGEQWAYSAGGHGVTYGTDRTVEYLASTQRISASVESSDAPLPPGVTPYFDPENPHIIGIDEDGLVIVRQVDEGGDPVDPYLGSDGIVHGTLPLPPGAVRGSLSASYAVDDLVDGAISGGPGDYDAAYYDITPDEVSIITSVKTSLRYPQ